MDDFSYINIFDTKGIEYLAIIAFLLLLIPFWLVLNKRVEIKEQFQKVMNVFSSGMPNIPQGIFYSKNHTWAFLEKSGVATVGLDDLILHITGDISVRSLKTPGDKIHKGELLAEINQEGKTLNVISPISGEFLGAKPVIGANYGIADVPSLENTWVCTIKPSNWVEEIPSCYLADDATKWLKNEFIRYKDFLSVNAVKYSPELSTVVLQDGGELSGNSLGNFPNAMWQDFEKEFLNA
jgi:glycine cleavage system H protein